jgi:hypothetical protein
VDTPPKVSLPGAQTQVTSDRGERKVINKIEATLGQSAILRCKVIFIFCLSKIQASILPMFYVQLLHAQIPKV